MNTRNLLVIVGLFIIVIFSCTKPKVYPIEPEISFEEMSMYDGQDTLGNDVKRVILTMKVTDGDGNIGLPEGVDWPGFDTLDYKNLFINLYNKVDGVFQKVDLVAPFHYRTAFLKPEGQDKSLIADFEITMDYTNFEEYDTIRYDFYIYDRDLHKSNVGISPAVPTDTTGVIK